MTVKLRNLMGPKQNVSISQPFAGTSSFILGMPEKGSIILFGQQEGELYPLTYLPSYTHGLENRNIKELPDDIKTIEQNEFYYRVKKLLKGELALGSAEGIELFLGNKSVLGDSFGNSFVLRSDNNSIVSTACNNSIFSSGIWLNSGIIKRNSVNTAFLEDNPNIFREPLPRGLFDYVLRPGGPNPHTDQYYTEYLLEVEDRGYSQPPENDINGDSNRTSRKPVGIFSMGSLVGNNPNYDGSYGRILRPILFNDVDDVVGEFKLEPVASGDIDTLGVAMCWFKPDRTDPTTGAFFGIDKEGHCFQFLPSTSGGGLGSGRSMSILAHGSKKEVWGKDARFANSWDLNTAGGIVWNIGSHNNKDGSPYNGRSIDTRTSSSVFYMYGSDVKPVINDFYKTDEPVQDPQNYLKVEKVGGKERHEVSGTRETIVSGSDYLAVNGARVEVVQQDNSVFYLSTMNLSVGDAFTEKVSKEKQETFGNRKSTMTSGSSELLIKGLQGSIKEDIKSVGGRSLKVTSGLVSEDIVLGSRVTKIKTGNFTTQIKAGNVKMSTKIGQVALQTEVGKMEMKASLNIDLKTKVASNVNLTGGTINLKGKTMNLGNVITSKTHKDFITGAALVGSVSVKATL